MVRPTQLARGMATAALVLLLFPACSPPDKPMAPAPRSLQAGVAALRTGDLQALRKDLGQGEGFAARARELADRLDPPTWLIAVGAHSAQHDLPAAIKAMNTGDDLALAEALGFGQQHLATSIFNAGSSVYSRQAGGRNFYETGPQPLDLIEGIDVPVLPEGSLALDVSLWGTLEGRSFRVDYTLAADGLVALNAGLEQARTEIEAPSRASRSTKPNDALPAEAMSMPVGFLIEPRFWGAEIQLLAPDGDLRVVVLGRNDKGWALVRFDSTTLEGRLSTIRDERLSLIAQRALQFEARVGRWPRGLNEVAHKPTQLVDPTSDGGRRGWAEYAAAPPVQMELVADADGDYVAVCTQTGINGRRAVARDGRLFWLEP